MRWMRQRLVIVATFVFLALAVAQTGSATSVAVSVALIAVGVLTSAHYASRALAGRELRVGGRARAHRQSLTGMAAPRHPSTPGRPMARAPGEGVSAA